MSIKHLYALFLAVAVFSQPALAQDDLTCADIEWSAVVTDRYPDIDLACNAVMEKNGQMYARVTVEVMRVSGTNITFKVIHRDGSSGGAYTQNVGNSWRANIGGDTYRARDLRRGQRLNVYMPPDRWAMIHDDEDGPDMEDAISLTAAPMLPETASKLPLAGLFGALLLMMGAALTLLRRQRERHPVEVRQES